MSRFDPFAWLMLAALLTAAGCSVRRVAVPPAAAEASRATPFTPAGAEPASSVPARPTEEIMQVAGDGEHYRQVAAAVEYSDAETAVPEAAEGSAEPFSLAAGEPRRYIDMTLEEVIRFGLENSTVLRDLGGAVLRAPEVVQTIHGPAIQETDPRFGVEAALSAFDARFSADAIFENNDRALNNTFFGGGTRVLTQDFNLYRAQISKRAATGSEFTVRSNTEYDANNAPGNLFRSAWDTNVEAEFRQPLLQGAGTSFNRIAGPGAAPGVINGLLIARLNRDIELADFQTAVRDYVSNLENAYWDLYFAYRDLDAKIQARERSLETWRIVKMRLGQLGFEADKEAQAREQYYRFQQEVQDALTGRVLDGTRTGNGSTGGTFRPTGGVHLAERRLRLLMGWPINDGSLIRPATEPAVAPVEFNWDLLVAEALSRRPELQRQRKRVRRRELELRAARNFLKPRLDAVGRYRWRGFGNDLLDSQGDNPAFDNAVENLTGGDFQEWQLGFEMSIPIGFRQAHAAVRHAELQLARERAVLREQEREIVHDLSNALADIERARITSQTAFDRLLAARKRVDLLQDPESRVSTPDLLLEAQSRLADAESRYFQSLIEYMIAVKNLHIEKGSLLDEEGVALTDASESDAPAPSPPDAQPAEVPPPPSEPALRP